MVVLMQDTVNLLMSMGADVSTIPVKEMKKFNNQPYYVLNFKSNQNCKIKK